ncbi:MAG: hypothetical protein HRU09_02350 [Oligoflexales bacterium]|nr:hypothetical protein [Oligoflexales bacterium]
MRIKNMALNIIVMALLSVGVVHAKPIKNKYGKTENGKMRSSDLEDLSAEVVSSQQQMSNEHFVEVVADPQKAINDQERLAALSAREIFILVDRSGSMGASDENPTGQRSSRWTRWDSARVAAESIVELALFLDIDNKVEVTLWSGSSIKTEVVSQINDISHLFSRNSPSGGTPLAEALEDVYKRRLKGLLKRSEPFTVIILTDGAPNDQRKVKKFFKKVIKDHHLEDYGRETLAAFSFVRMGDDSGATRSLQDLDDNLIRELGVKVDIVDTKP